MKNNPFNNPFELEKAYQEGIYSDTPGNRKLGRVGMTYKQYEESIKKEIKEKEQPKSKEESLNELKEGTYIKLKNNITGESNIVKFSKVENENIIGQDGKSFKINENDFSIIPIMKSAVLQPWMKQRFDFINSCKLHDAKSSINSKTGEITISKGDEKIVLKNYTFIRKDWLDYNEEVHEIHIDIINKEGKATKLRTFPNMNSVKSVFQTIIDNKFKEGLKVKLKSIINWGDLEEKNGALGEIYKEKILDKGKFKIIAIQQMSNNQEGYIYKINISPSNYQGYIECSPFGLKSFNTQLDFDGYLKKVDSLEGVQNEYFNTLKENTNKYV